MYQSTMTEETPAPKANGELDGKRISREPDGSIIIEDAGGPQPRIPQEGDHDENLASKLTRGERMHLADKLMEFADVDKQSREDWERREKDSMRMLGLTDRNKAVDNAVPTNVHNVTHPMLVTACMRFQASAIVELYPPAGPVKTQIIGKTSPDKVAQADRIETFNNYYLTKVDRGYFHDTDQMLGYLPQGGSAFRKAQQDWVTGLPKLRYVKGTNFIAPYIGTDLDSMPRYAHEFTMSGQDIRRAINIGMFLKDVNLVQPTGGEVTHSEIADIADDRQAILHQDDRLYEMYEYHIDLELAQDEQNVMLDDKRQPITGTMGEQLQDALPYIVVVERNNREILLIRRNWRKKDPQRRKRRWFAHHRYLPGLGFYGFGLPHVIGSLGDSATGVVNAILDAALASTMQGGFKTKEGRAVGEVHVEHGVYKDVDATYEDLSKAFFTPDFKPPGPVMVELLKELVGAGDRFAGTVDVAVGDAPNNAPVGTTLALIEQSQKPQAAVHKRLYASFSDEFEMFNELVEDFMPDDYQYKIGDEEQHLLKSDYDGRVDIFSVADPNIYSDQQRIMRGQAIKELQQQSPDLYTPAKRAAADLRLMKALKIDNIEEIGPEVEQPKYLDPVSENGLITVGKGVMAFEPQDHAAHIAIHQNGAAHALAGIQDPQENQQIQAAFSSHIRQHMAFAYRQVVFQKAGIQPPPLGPDNLPQQLDPEVERQISQAVMNALPPAPPPGQLAGEGQQVLDASTAKIQAMDQESKAKIVRDTEEFTAAQKRAEEEHREEQRRADEAAQADEARKDAAAAAEIHRAGRQAAHDLEHKKASDNVALHGAAQKHLVGVEGGKAKNELAVQGTKAKTDAAVEGARSKNQVAVEGARAKTGAAVEGQREKTSAMIEGQRKQTDQKVADAKRQGDQKVRQSTKEHGAKMKQSAAEGEQKLEQSKAQADQQVKAQKKKDQVSVDGALKKAEVAIETARQAADQKLSSTKKMDTHRLHSSRREAAEKRRQMTTTKAAKKPRSGG